MDYKTQVKELEIIRYMICQLNEMGDSESVWTFEFKHKDSNKKINEKQRLADSVIHWFKYHEGFNVYVSRESFVSDNPHVKLTVRKA